jgi:hypothetical protein
VYNRKHITVWLKPLGTGATPPLFQIEHYGLSAPTAGAEYAELVTLWISQHNP